MVIKRGALINGMAYTFSLLIKDLRSNTSGQASLELPPNLPPRGGECRLFPPKVVALETKVTVTCQNWTDSDNAHMTLYYKIYAEHYDAELGDSVTYSIYHGTRTTNTFYLSPWPGVAANGDVNVIVMVQDQLETGVIALNK